MVPLSQPTSLTGIVKAFDLVIIIAKKSSFHPKINEIRKHVTTPGALKGKTNLKSISLYEHPSIMAASSIEMSIVSKNDFERYNRVREVHKSIK